MMTHDEMIAVLQAMKENKKLQYRHIADTGDTWHDRIATPADPPDFSRYEYRIKPEPCEYWLLRHKNATEAQSAAIFSNKPFAQRFVRNNMNRPGEWEIIHVREVMES